MIKMYSEKEEINQFLSRERFLSKGNKHQDDIVREIVSDVRKRKDIALTEWTLKLDKVNITHFELEVGNLEVCLKNLDQELREALERAGKRIYQFHKSQPVASWIDSNLGGQLGQKITPIKNIGIYIPGGTSPLISSVLMSAIPAVVAGTENIIFTSPPNKDGEINKMILAACALIQQMGVNIRIFRIGGAQAIAAMAFGTPQVPKVDKIVGPGNIYVNLAKKEVYGVVGIDGIYGPTEALILADDTANPKLVAADLLAQAEHDSLAIPILITPSKELAIAVKKEIKKQLESLERREIIREAITTQGGIILTNSIEESIKFSNKFAPEHLSVMVKEPTAILDQIENAGGIFVGENSFEVLGDYIAGPSHVMPTNGTARFSSPLSVVDFVKRISIVNLNKTVALDLSKEAVIIAQSENLTGHANSASLRINVSQNKEGGDIN
jgi:histidinol dehydrogenase